MCLCEVAAYCKKHGMTLWDMMLETYKKYGYYKESQYTITLKGIDGSRQIAEIMDKLRGNPPKAFGYTLHSLSYVSRLPPSQALWKQRNCLRKKFPSLSARRRPEREPDQRIFTAQPSDPPSAGQAWPGHPQGCCPSRPCRT